jgi:hypothetical protein
MKPARISHSLSFAVPAPYIAVCARCGQRLRHLSDVASPCPPLTTAITSPIHEAQQRRAAVKATCRGLNGG